MWNWIIIYYYRKSLVLTYWNRSGEIDWQNDNVDSWLVYSFKHYLCNWNRNILVRLGGSNLVSFSYFRNRNRFGSVKKFRFYRNAIKLNFIRANYILMEPILKDNIQFMQALKWISLNSSFKLICQMRFYPREKDSFQSRAQICKVQSNAASHVWRRYYYNALNVHMFNLLDLMNAFLAYSIFVEEDEMVCVLKRSLENF